MMIIKKAFFPFGFIFLIALFLRFLHLQSIQTTPEFLAPGVDAAYHDYWAWGLASGQWESVPLSQENPKIQDHPFFRPPLYPYFLAGIYKIQGRDYFQVACIQIIIGSLSCLLLTFLADLLFGRLSAWLAGGLMALYWIFPYFDCELREIVLLVFLYLSLVLTQFYYFSRPRIFKLILAGFLLGLSVLGKPNLLLFIPVGAVWIAFFLIQRRSKLHIFCHVLVFIATATLVISLATLRNTIQTKDFVCVSSNGGINLLIGNNMKSTGYSVEMPSQYPKFRSAFDYLKIMRSVERIQGRSLKASEVSAYFTSEAFQFIKQHPLQTFQSMIKKNILFWTGVELTSERDLYAAVKESAVLRRIFVPYAFLLALACLGFISQFRNIHRSQRSEPVYHTLVFIGLLVGVYSLSFSPFFVTSRYRVPIIPFVVLFSSQGIRTCVLYFKNKNALAFIKNCLFVFLLFLLFNYKYFQIKSDPSYAVFSRAVSLQSLQQYDKAIASFKRALEMKPHFAEAYHNIGYCLEQQGRTGEALEAFETALTYNPDLYESLYLGAKIYVEKKEFSRAVDLLNHAISIQPDSAEVFSLLGFVMIEFKQDQQAEKLLQQAVLLGSRDPVDYVNLATLYYKQNKFSEAVPLLETLIQLRPGQYLDYYKLGLMYEALGRKDKAMVSFQAVLKLNPHFDQASRHLRALGG